VRRLKMADKKDSSEKYLHFIDEIYAKPEEVLYTSNLASSKDVEYFVEKVRQLDMSYRSLVVLTYDTKNQLISSVPVNSFLDTNCPYDYMANTLNGMKPSSQNKINARVIMGNYHPAYDDPVGIPIYVPKNTAPGKFIVPVCKAVTMPRVSKQVIKESVEKYQEPRIVKIIEKETGPDSVIRDQNKKLSGAKAGKDKVKADKLSKEIAKQTGIKTTINQDQKTKEFNILIG